MPFDALWPTIWLTDGRTNWLTKHMQRALHIICPLLRLSWLTNWLIDWLTDCVTEWVTDWASTTHNSLYFSLFVFDIVWFALLCFGLLWLVVCWPRLLAPFVGLLLWLYTCLHSQWPQLPQLLNADCRFVACHLLLPPPLCGPNLFAWLTPLKVVKPLATTKLWLAKRLKASSMACLLASTYLF